MENAMLQEIIQDTMTLEKILDEKKRIKFMESYNELLEIVDDNGKAIGSAPRGFAHRVGLRHRTVFVLIWSPDGKLLLQRRGRDASSSQFRLDISVGGHVKFGESDLRMSAIREVKEELGFDPDPVRVKFVSEYNREGSYSIEKPYERNRERRTLFEYGLMPQEVANLDKLFKDRESKGEVESFSWFSISDVISSIDAGKVADGLMTNLLHWLDKNR